MVNKIIAVLLALLVIVCMVSCAADKKETSEGEDEEEQTESAQDLLPDDPAAMDLSDEEIGNKVDYFIEALYSPNVIMLVEALHPDVLTYMTQLEGLSEEALHDAIEEADARIRDAWASTAEGIDHTSLIRDYSYRQLDDSALQTLNEPYMEMGLTVDCAISIDVSMSYEDTDLGSFAICLVKIGGQWWLDPVNTSL